MACCITKSPYPVATFVRPSVAMEWLGTADTLEVILDVERCLEVLIGSSTMLFELRARLTRCPGT